MERRSLFYWSWEYVHSIEAGQRYGEIPDVICINILDFAYINLKDEFHTSFHYYEDRHKERLLTKAAEIHFIEIPQFRNIVNKDVQNDPLHRWLTYLDIKTPLPLIKEIVEMDSAIAKTQAVVDSVSRNSAMLHAYLKQQMAIMDEASILHDALEDQAIEIAKNALAKGLTWDTISDITGLDIKTIERLAND
jgi:predicted transposase/invertase (TIGR01784 family)